MLPFAKPQIWRLSGCLIPRPRDSCGTRALVSSCFRTELGHWLASVVGTPATKSAPESLHRQGCDATGGQPACASALRGHKEASGRGYQRFVEAGIGQKSQEEYYRAAEGRLLGGEDFLEEIKHRVGEHRRQRKKPLEPISMEKLIEAAERTSGLRRKYFCGKGKTRGVVAIREAVIVLGRERGMGNKELALALGIDESSVTRRIEAARLRLGESAEVVELRRALASGKR